MLARARPLFARLSLFLALAPLGAASWARPPATKGPLCEKYFTNRPETAEFEKTRAVLRAFRDAYREDPVYVAGACHTNVIRLFNALKARVPDLERDEFRVVLIGPKDGIVFDWIDARLIRLRNAFARFAARLTNRPDLFAARPASIQSPQARRWDSPRPDPSFVGWAFHVVLEYRGFVLDLDNQDRPTVHPISRYAREFFLDRHRIESHPGVAQGPEDLGAWISPGGAYLWYSDQDELMRYVERLVRTARSTPLAELGQDQTGAPR